MQTPIWYAAYENNAKPMTVADYANLMTTEVSRVRAAVASDVDAELRSCLKTAYDLRGLILRA